MENKYDKEEYETIDNGFFQFKKIIENIINDLLLQNIIISNKIVKIKNKTYKINIKSILPTKTEYNKSNNIKEILWFLWIKILKSEDDSIEKFNDTYCKNYDGCKIFFKFNIIEEII